MKYIIKIKGICILTALVMFISCQFKKPTDPCGPAIVTLQFQMSEDHNPGFLFNVRKENQNDPVNKSNARPVQSNKNPALPQVLQSIDEVEIVFFDIQMTFDELMASYYAHEQEIDSLSYTWQGDWTDFEEFWVALYEELINIVTEGKYRIEKRAPLNIEGHHAMGEFELAEGLKFCLVGCFEQDALHYVGESYEVATDTPFINLESGERKEVTIILMDVSWYWFNYPPFAFFTVYPYTGQVGTVFTVDASYSWDLEDAASALQVRWDWESDGTWDTNYTTIKTATHQYASAGTHTITLEVRDSDTMTDQAQDQVTVTNVTAETGTVTDIDGNVYQTIKIGNQWWMAENLKVTHYRNGDLIPNVTDNTEWGNLTTGAYCNYNNDVNHVTTYGRLYNWYTVNDNRNIAPIGWHVPTDEEWKELEMYLGMSQSESDAIGYRGTDEGGKMKELGTTHWVSPNTGATNESGFSALPGGYRYDDGIFYDMGTLATFWASIETGTLYAWGRVLYSDRSYVRRDVSDKQDGFSVRCLKD